MGGRSRSSSKVNTTNNFRDERIAATDNATVFRGSTVTLNTSDAGAVKAGADLGREAIRAGVDQVAIALGSNTKTLDSALEFAGRSNEQALAAIERADSQSEALGDIVKFGVPALLAGTAVVALAAGGAFK